MLAITNQTSGNALAIGALEVPGRAQTAPLVAEISTVVMAITAVQVRQTAPDYTPKLSGTTERPTACTRE